jgi:hypothetical protein
MSFSRELRMNPSSLTPIEYAALRDRALRQAHELRRQAITDTWNAAFSALRRLLGRGRDRVDAPRPPLKA